MPLMETVSGDVALGKEGIECLFAHALKNGECFGPVGAWPQKPVADLGILSVASLLVILDLPVHISLLSPICCLIQDLLLLPLEYSPMRLCPLIGLFPVFSGHIPVPLEQGDDLLPVPLNLTFTSVIPSQSNLTHGSEKSCVAAQDPRPS